MREGNRQYRTSMFTTMMEYQVTIIIHAFLLFKPYALIKVITIWMVGTSLKHSGSKEATSHCILTGWWSYSLQTTCQFSAPMIHFLLYMDQS